MSKPMTAAALMILVDEGKVKLDDPVEKYLPEFREQWLAVERDKKHILLKKPKVRMTVRHLLSHTSGLPFASRIEQPTLDRLTLRQGVLSYTMTPLHSEPGSKFVYSNAGINTAGRIIEVVSKMPYEQFMHRRLFEPLGMKDTTFRPGEKQLARLAKAYRANEKGAGLVETPITQLSYPLTDPRRQPMPAGGLFSTAADVGNFCRMMLAGGELEGKRIVSEKAVKEMTTKQTGDLPRSYGLGWGTGAKPGDPYGHGGAYNTQMRVEPGKGLVLVLLVHHANFPGKEGGKIRDTFLKAAREKYGK
jgi:CubicO group peptidase (beta-lactamase class C family)